MLRKLCEQRYRGTWQETHRDLCREMDLGELNHRESLNLGSEVCLDLGIGKPLPLSQQEIGGVRFGQDVDE